MPTLLPGTFGLWTAYLFTATLALSVCLGSRLSYWLKIVALLLVFATIAHYLITMGEFKGWPSTGKTPQNFRLLAASVEEPDKVHNRSGTIYLWTMSLDENPLPKPPRAYRLPYSLQLHDKVNAALTKVRRGLPQIGQLQSDPQRQAGASITQGTAPELEFFDVPDPLFPEH